jgi:predicted ArsR family transcriptional regulator
MAAASAQNGEATPSTDQELERVLAVLTAHGYEPERHEETVTLENCPSTRGPSNIAT